MCSLRRVIHRDFNMTRILLFAVSVIGCFANSLIADEYENPVLSIGDVAPTWSDLPGVDGKQHSSAALAKKQAVVVTFICNSCPYAVDYEDRLIALAKKYSGKDSPVAIVAVNVNTITDDAMPAMKAKAKKKSFPFPYLFDESQKIAREFGAGTTPEFFVLNSKRRVVYMGAMDDNSRAEKVTRHYVQEAISAALAGKKPSVEKKLPIGCRVRFERRRRKPKKKKK
jgi:peroxiredoxin